MEKWEADGAWREEANTRIEENRKRNIKINFPNIDATDLTINYQQLSHQFPFGMGPQRSENVQSFCYFSEIIQLNFLTNQSEG